MIDFFPPLSHEVQYGTLPVEFTPTAGATYHLTQVVYVVDNFPPPPPRPK